MRTLSYSLVLASTLLMLMIGSVVFGQGLSGLGFSTFLGGKSHDSVSMIAMDPQGNLVIVGWTDSPDFPTIPGALDPVFRGDDPVEENDRASFVTKLTADGSELIFSTFLGRGPGLIGAVVAIDAEGNIVIAGNTTSPDFPLTPGALNITSQNDEEDTASSDIFVITLSADGSRLLSSSRFGGTDHEAVQGIALDPAGNPVITGMTRSADFPTTPGAFDTTFNSVGTDKTAIGDIFVTKLSKDGNRLLFSTFVGGSDHDGVQGIALDPDGNVVLTGFTHSSDFPHTAGAFNTSLLNRSSDAFVLKLAEDGSDLLFSTFLGGARFDGGTGVTIDAVGDIVVTGATLSDDFPTTAGAFDTTVNRGLCGEGGAFVAKLTADGSALVFSTFLGGGVGNNRCGGEVDFLPPGPLFMGGQGITIDSAGNVVITGVTSSSDFPTTPGAFDRTFNGGRKIMPLDAYVTKLAADGSRLLYSTFLGGRGNDRGFWLTLNTNGDVVITGFTESATFPVTPRAFDTTFNTIEKFRADVFVTKLDLHPFEFDAPDLTGAITKFTMKTTKNGNEILRFRVKVGNTGNRKAKGPFTVTAFLSENDVLDEGDDELLKTWTIPQLRKGGIVKLKGKIKNPSLATNQFLLVVLDADDEIVEVDETNNVVIRHVLHDAR